MGFEARFFWGFQAVPVIFDRNSDILFIDFAVFIGHFEKQQVGELFEIIAITYPVIPQRVAETPNFRDNACRVVHFLPSVE